MNNKLGELQRLFDESVKNLTEVFEGLKAEIISVDKPQAPSLINQCKPGDKLRYLGGHEGYKYLTKGKTYEVISKGRHGTDDVPILKIADDRYYYYDNALVRPETAEYFERVDESVEEIELSPNEQRAALIERAKEFVESRLDKFGKVVFYSDGNARRRFTAKFIVNEEKITVACLLGGFANHNKIHFRGIAKCMPNEVFNEHIGKAIALARALKIDVPGEFLDAVQPTEKVIGMEVYNEEHDLYAELTEIYRGAPRTARYKSRFASESIIIDDTNAIYGS